MRVAIIIPYFGKFPVWFELYLYSCSKNPQVDFIFFTDCELPERVYDNTIFYKTDFESYCKWVSECLLINFKPKDPYKLCDLKPFYGIIHRSELEPYDFWGFGDIDLIYGDLNIIINDDSLRKYDIITALSDRVAGHFTVIRKDSRFTELCKKVPNYKEILEKQENIVFDEVAWCNSVYPQLKNIGRISRHILEPLKIISRYHWFNWCGRIFCNRLTKRKFWDFKTTPKPQMGEQWLYDINKGEVLDPGGESIPYLHFFLFKDNRWEKLEHSWCGEYYSVRNKDLFAESGNIVVDINGIKYITL